MHCRGLRLNELNVPAHRKPLFDAEKRLAIAQSIANKLVPNAAPKEAHANDAPGLVAHDAQTTSPKLSSSTTERLTSPHVPEKTPATVQNKALNDTNSSSSTVPPPNGSLAGSESNGVATAPTTSKQDVQGKINGVVPGTTAARTIDSALPTAKKPRVDQDGDSSKPQPISTENDGRPLPQDANGVSDIRGPNADQNRYPDAMSSPGSTALSAPTPAIHPESADTSPDTEGPQYMEGVEETSTSKSEEAGAAKLEGAGEKIDGVLEQPRELEERPTSAVSGVEAQLLQESVAAQLAEPTTPAASQLVTDKKQAVAEDATVPQTPSVEELQSDTVSSTIPAVTEQPLQEASTAPVSPAEGLEATVPKPNASAVETRPSTQPETSTGSSLSVPEKQPAAASGSNPSTPLPPDHSQTTQTAPTETSPIQTQPPSIPTITVEPPRPTTAEAEAIRAVEVTAAAAEAAEEEAEKALSAPQLRLLANKTRDRRRRSVPTVIFGKATKKVLKAQDDSALVLNRQRPGYIPSDDYFTPLFIEGFTRTSTWMKPIEKLLSQAHKTVSTSDQYVSILDHQACKILRRVYHLQQHDKWSLRQPVRCPEPPRPTSHFDVLLQEMKWMRTDFREERKWKRAVAKNLAYACAEWVHSSKEERLALQVNAVLPPRAVPLDGDAQMADTSDIHEEPLPDLAHLDSPMGNDDESLESMVETVAPSIIFALHDDEVVFPLQPSKTADLLLSNLPMYGSPLQVPTPGLKADEDADAKWKRSAVPLSKFVEGEMLLVDSGPPRKRSKFDYRPDYEEDDADEVIFGTQLDNTAQAQPENTTAALFNPEWRIVRDRIHACHQVHPPTEHSLPPQSFYECRTASQWTIAEDHALKSLALEYNYNWSLISNMISSKSSFVSGAERRTPWECFERWMSLEGTPNEMGKTPYIRLFQTRIDNAQKVIAQQNQQAAQQVGPNGAVTPVPRKRPTLSMRVERRRNQKHLALIDAMRKLAKKRESAAQKAQQNANMQAMRKVNEANKQVIPPKTPREYSLMRAERDHQLTERMLQYHHRQAEAKKLLVSLPIATFSNQTMRLIIFHRHKRMLMAFLVLLVLFRSLRQVRRFQGLIHLLRQLV